MRTRQKKNWPSHPRQPGASVAVFWSTPDSDCQMLGGHFGRGEDRCGNARDQPFALAA